MNPKLSKCLIFTHGKGRFPFGRLFCIPHLPATLGNVNANSMHLDENKANIFTNYLVNIFQLYNTILLPKQINLFYD